MIFIVLTSMSEKDFFQIFIYIIVKMSFRKAVRRALDVWKILSCTHAMPLDLVPVVPPQRKVEVMLPSIDKKGVRRALLIGSNYKGTAGELKGCVNDLENIKTVLESNEFKHIHMVADGLPSRPTRETILSELKRFLKNGTDDELLYIHFSGHGTQTLSLFDSSESDKMDECICTFEDDKSLKTISDNEMNRIVRENLRKTARLYVVFDCCHSGSMLDLRYEYAASAADKWRENTAINDTLDCGHVVMLSGCRDAQVSIDSVFSTKEGVENQGALTYCLVNALSETQTTLEVYQQIHEQLKENKINQHPILSTNIRFDMATKYLS